MTIIKYLNIIKNTNNGSSAILGGAPPQNQDKQKQINQNQEINSQEQNPGKTYIKNFTDIYISLVKEYYKFIKSIKFFLIMNFIHNLCEFYKIF